MRFGIIQIEKQFNSQKNRLLNDLDRLERRKRVQFTRVAREFDYYKRREDVLRRMESATSAHLRQINAKIVTLKRLDEGDRKRIKDLMNGLSKTRREIPRLEREIRNMGPAKAAAARKEKVFYRKLSSVSARVNEIERKRDKIKRDIEVLGKKENMLRQGKIYWTVNQQKKDQKLGFFQSKKDDRRENSRRESARRANVRRANEKRANVRRSKERRAREKPVERSKPNLFERIIIGKK